MKGKLYNLTLAGYIFPVLTSDSDRALTFYKMVFPDQNIEPRDVVLVERIYTVNGLHETFRNVKKEWADLKLLQAEPGTIRFNLYALDLLLETHEHILTNM